MATNEVIIWVTQLNHGSEPVFLSQTVYLNHLGQIVAVSWRAQVYAADCERGGTEPDFEGLHKLPKYQALRLYHVRKARVLDEHETLENQDVQEGDVFVLGPLNSDMTTALVRNKRIPSSIDPNKHPGRTSLAIADVFPPSGTTPTIGNPWLSGSFYLATTVVVIAFLAGLANLVSLWVLPIILIASVLLVMLIGVLTTDHKLNGDRPRILLAIINSLPLLGGSRRSKGEQ
jgi:hypothetical protein